MAFFHCIVAFPHIPFTSIRFARQLSFNFRHVLSSKALTWRPWCADVANVCSVAQNDVNSRSPSSANQFRSQSLTSCFHGRTHPSHPCNPRLVEEPDKEFFRSFQACLQSAQSECVSAIDFSRDFCFLVNTQWSGSESLDKLSNSRHQSHQLEFFVFLGCPRISFLWRGLWCFATDGVQAIFLKAAPSQG